MKTVHKHVIPTGPDGLELQLPQGFRLLKAEYLLVSKQVCCWIEVPTDPRLPVSALQLRLFRSGDGIPAAYTYVDTAIDALAPEAWHLYARQQEASRQVA